jgi:hypothetical protein
MKIQITTAILTGMLSLIPAIPAFAADMVSPSGSASVTRLNSHDLMIQGASDTASVQLHFAGAERLDAGAPGELFVTSHGSRRHYQPGVYQIVNGKTRPLTVSFTVEGSDRVTVNFGKFDDSVPIFVRGGASTL